MLIVLESRNVLLDRREARLVAHVCARGSRDSGVATALATVVTQLLTQLGVGLERRPFLIRDLGSVSVML